MSVEYGQPGPDATVTQLRKPHWNLESREENKEIPPSTYLHMHCRMCNIQFICAKIARKEMVLWAHIVLAFFFKYLYLFLLPVHNKIISLYIMLIKEIIVFIDRVSIF